MSDRVKHPEAPSPCPKRCAVRTAPAYIFPLAVLAIAGAVYLLCLSNHLTQDSVAYIFSAVTGRELFHPHHLAYNPLMRCIVLLMGPARIETIVSALQYSNIVIALLSVWFVWLVVRRIGSPAWAAALYSMFFALSGGMLTYSSQVEVYTVTGLFLSIAAYGLVCERSPLGPALAAGGWFGAMLFHQTAIFFGVAWAVHALLTLDRPFLRRFAVMFALPLIAVGVVYLAVCRSLNYSTIVECWQWITSYAHKGFWGKGTLSYDTFRLGLAGMLEALDLARGKYALGLLFCFVVVSLLTDRRHVIENRSFLAGCCAWFVVQGSFSLWWFAPNSEFWIFALLPITFSLAAIAHSRRQAPQHLLLTVLISVPIMLTIALSCLSAAIYFQRNSSPNYIMTQVEQCVGVVASQDTVVTADNEMLQYCRLYLASDHVIAFNGHIARKAVQSHGGKSFTQKLLEALDAELHQAQKRGGAVFVDQRVVSGSLNPIRLMKDFDSDEFRKGIVRRFNVLPLDIQQPQWYRIHSLAGDSPALAPVVKRHN